jgi:hypothetical protein
LATCNSVTSWQAVVSSNGRPAAAMSGINVLERCLSRVKLEVCDHWMLQKRSFETATCGQIAHESVDATDNCEIGRAADGERACAGDSEACVGRPDSCQHEQNYHRRLRRGPSFRAHEGAHSTAGPATRRRLRRACSATPRWAPSKLLFTRRSRNSMIYAYLSCTISLK